MRRRRFVLMALVCALATVLLGACSASDIEDEGGETLEDRVAQGTSVRAERGSKSLSISRTDLTGARPKGIEKGTWTVLVYLCGSDLETKGGAATRDLAEMVGASGSENVTFVVETGGAKKWQGGVGGKGLSRYAIQDGAIMEVERAKAADMGKPSTLADFIVWGLKNYPAEHMGLILWDHGGGSVSGVCFDEKNDYDSLLLNELDQAFSQASIMMWQKFDFVGFDACLMSTLECANVVASYADYMYASQEVEPGCGWEYSTIMEYLAAHPTAGAAELGKELADAYVAAVPRNSQSTLTLSIVDLSETDRLMQDFYKFSQEMYESSTDDGTLAAMARGIRKADSFGGNNLLEGYTNMVDLGGIVNACSSVTPSAKDVQDTLGRAVSYQVRGRNHSGSSGLSVYYPLSVGDSRELTVFETVAANPSYLSYVDRLAHGATFAGTPSSDSYTSYADDSWFTEEGLWNLLLTGADIYMTLSERSIDPRWAYVDEHDSESKVISFEVEPTVDDEGVLWMQFAKDSINNAAAVSALVSLDEDGSERTLGETFDIYGDWEEGIIEDGFDGRWLTLPDGQLLCLYVVEATVDDAVFTSPVLINGEQGFLRIHQDLETGEATVEGVLRDASESGLAARLDELVLGDEIVPLYTERPEAGVGAGKLSCDDKGEPFVVEGELVVDYGDLPLGTYHYAFNVTDVFGDRYVCDPVTFEIEQDGIYFTE